MDAHLEAALMQAGHQIAALQREISELRQDAERYRRLAAADNEDDYAYDIDEVDLLERSGVRTRDFTTGRITKWSGETEIVRFYADGLRVYASWVSGGPVSPKQGQCVLVAPYKYCSLLSLADVFVDALLGAKTHDAAVMPN